LVTASSSVPLRLALGSLGIPRHVDGAGGDRDLVHALPRPAEVRPAGRHDLDLRIHVALLLVVAHRAPSGVNTVVAPRMRLARPKLVITARSF
jgi:hypothetical protein